ncbi:TRAP transporter large permease [Ferrovibrio sp.]|uniref:TRAP transporter large permease n=1 Tax=Ferrovibrio sp. TaxID=1917215 RepID=UPI0035AFE8A3
MDRTIIGLIGVGIALLLIFLRVPIGVAMGIVGFGGIATLISWHAAIGIAKAIPYQLIGDWNLSAVPMFLLMGYVASATGLTNGLFASARIFFARVPGALASATVLACAFFASASGSSVATSAAFSRISIPEMLKAKYDPALATGCVASAGTLGSLIPPSILMIVFGIMADTSISQLFMAGVIPGILSAAMFMGYIALRVKLNPALAPRDDTQYSWAEKKAALMDVWPLPVLIIGVLGGIFSGMFTATEAGAIGAMIACVIAAARRSLTRETFRKAIVDTAEGTAAIFIIVVGAAIFARFMSYSQLPAAMSQSLLSITDSPLLMILAISAIFLVLGCVLESISIMLLTMPLLLPLLKAMDVDMVWFGILVIKLLEIGLVTPPVGMNVYVIKSSLGDRVSLTTIFRGAFGFIAADMVTLALLISFPIITLWLPNLLAR